MDLIWSRLEQVNNHLSNTAHSKVLPPSLTQGHPYFMRVFYLTCPLPGLLTRTNLLLKTPPKG